MSRTFVKVATVQHLAENTPLLVKTQGKQIVLFQSGEKILACNNRCPHEGYPLSEGSFSSDCILTCNWHNWKFDLKNGETLVGGDQLRTYEAKIIKDEIWLDITDPPQEIAIEKSLKNLKASFRRQEYDRMAREISRLEHVGGDPLEAVRHSIFWTHDRFEYGMTHAFAATPDWLSLRKETALSASERLVPIIESVGHMSWDSLREDLYPFTNNQMTFDARAFEKALEEENEDTAISYLNGAVRDHVDLKTIFRSLGRVVLNHYADFGHSAIYVYKIKQLIEKLGEQIKEPALRALVRSLIYASREDLLPEFRRYQPTLAAWNNGIDRPEHPFDIEGAGVNAALFRTAEFASENVTNLYAALLRQLARNMLYFNTSIMHKWDNSVSNNISWLDFSHGVTFANAVRDICTDTPELWPQGLLQMACFSGRNSSFIDLEQEVDRWFVEDVDLFFKISKQKILDHANPEFIVSAHLIKIITAVEEEVRNAPHAPFVKDLLAATNRVLNSPFKRKHTKRVAYQSIEFVAREG